MKLIIELDSIYSEDDTSIAGILQEEINNRVREAMRATTNSDKYKTEINRAVNNAVYSQIHKEIDECLKQYTTKWVEEYIHSLFKHRLAQQAAQTVMDKAKLALSSL